MITWRVRNVGEALNNLREQLGYTGHWREIAPRGQRTLEFVEPVCTVYERPTERVLTDPARDANPFFHLMEALWLLAGRRDVKTLARFNSRIGAFSDDGQIFHGAYGYRLRYPTDQVAWAIERLRADPDTRQVVLTIWQSLLDFQPNVRTMDFPCNTQLFLKIRDGRLNMLVTCRSNDAILGAYGANAVQFSILQEYIAAHVGVPVGEYRQLSDSLHVYLDQEAYRNTMKLSHYPHAYADIAPVPLVRDPKVFDDEVKALFYLLDTGSNRGRIFQEPFIENTVRPMANTWSLYKTEQREMAYVYTAKIAAPDWRVACGEWIKRRLK